MTAAAERHIRAGHPWVFSDSVREQNRPGQVGDLAVIYDRKDRFLAVGLLDPDSPIRVRILHTGKPQQINREWWVARFDQAVERRQGLFNAETTGYRLIHGESDGWPGLVLDRYGDTLVLKLYTGAWRPRLEKVIGIIRERLKPERIVVRWSRNVREGGEEHLPLVNDESGAIERTPHPACGHPLPIRWGEGRVRGGPGSRSDEGRVIVGPPLSGPVVFSESGLLFEADVLRGQKTGFFLDQRENRRRVETLSRGRTVLNAFSFSGGFSLYAARGGAISVTDLDISAHALSSAERNFALNSRVPAIARSRHELARADAFDWLAANSDRKFGMVILDPPSFAKRESERAGAVRAYGRLAVLGMANLERGGILVACSCSAHVAAAEFFEVVRGAMKGTKRRFEELAVTGHPQDHPAVFKEAEYLKAIYLKIDLI